MLNQLADLKQQQTINNNVSNLFVAKVVNNNDPLKAQRVQFRIAKIHRGIADQHLPWASPGSLTLQGNNQIGALKVPVNGSTIIVEFLDEYNTIYRGDFITEGSNNELVANNYPHCYGFTDRSGNLLYVNTETDSVSFTHVSGTTISINQTGNITINSKGTANIEGDSISLKATNNINLDCATLNINSTTTNLSATNCNVNSTNCNMKANGTNVIEGASITMNSSGAVTTNAANFTLKAAFNLTPTTGWVSPPVATATAPTAVLTPPATRTAPTARTKPTIPGFTNQTDY